MNKLHRYIFFSLLTVVSGTVAVFIFILLTGNIFRHALGLIAAGQLSFATLVQFIVVLIPYVLSYALPLGILSGVLIVLGRLSSQQEITAMKSAGVGIKTFSCSVLFIAAVSSFLILFINNYYAPLAKQNYRTILTGAIADNPVEFIQPKVFITDFKGYIIYVDEKTGTQLENFWIWVLDDEKRVNTSLRAHKGTLVYDEKNTAIILTLYDATGEKRNDKRPEDFSGDIPMIYANELPISLPLEKLLGENTPKLKLSTMTLGQILEYKEMQEQMLGSAQTEKQQERIKKEIYESDMRIHFNMASAFSTFSLVLLGIPLGIQVGRKESYANIAIALVLALAFFVLQTSIDAVFNKTITSAGPFLLWVPNFLFQGLGFYLIIRASRK